MGTTSKWLIRAVLPIAIVCVIMGSARLAAAQSCSTYAYHPASYTNGSPGDVALTVAESQLVQGLTQTLAMSFGHAAVLYDASGYLFTESTVNNASPPSSNSTGEPHVCSRVISPYYLQRLSPGVLNASPRDARDGVLVRGGARPYCTAPQDTYHINSIKFRDIHGGSCAAMAEDDCGAQVSGWWQRSFSPTDHYNAAIFLYQATYNQCVSVIDGFWPWHGIGCGGVPATGEYYGLEQWGNASACDRAAAQVVNEFAIKGLQSCAAGVCDGWSDYDVFGNLLGGAKDNWQVGADWYNGFNNFTPRTPDNILASAGPAGHEVIGTNIVGGYYTYSQREDGSCCGGGCRGTCDSGQCQYDGGGGAGGGPAMIKSY